MRRDDAGPAQPGGGQAGANDRLRYAVTVVVADTDGARRFPAAVITRSRVHAARRGETPVALHDRHGDAARHGHRANDL